MHAGRRPETPRRSSLNETGTPARSRVSGACERTLILKTFQDLGLSKPILQALAQEGYETPTPIQTQAIPLVAAGRDLLGIAQTGTGKTAAFALPILHRLAADRKTPLPRTCRALIL